MSSKCPVCLADNTTETHVGLTENEYLYSCKRCGEFILKFRGDDLAHPEMLGQDVEKRATLSHWIRTKYEACRKEPPDKHGGRAKPYLSGELVKNIIRNPRPSLTEQADNYVRWIGDNVKVGGQYIAVEELAIQAIVGSATIDEFELVSSHLRDEKLIGHKSEPDIWRKVTLSFAGWQRYRELKRATADSRKAFMAMQYNEPELESIVENVFRDAIRQTGFDLFILRDHPKAGLIDDRLRAEIRAARFLIADLTHGNAGAYWEAGYAEGLGKPVIYTCEKKVFEDSKSRPHFDTNHHQTVLWDAERPEIAAKELQATICASLPEEAKLTDD